MDDVIDFCYGFIFLLHGVRSHHSDTVHDLRHQ